MHGIREGGGINYLKTNMNSLKGPDPRQYSLPLKTLLYSTLFFVKGTVGLWLMVHSLNVHFWPKWRMGVEVTLLPKWLKAAENMQQHFPNCGQLTVMNSNPWEKGTKELSIINVPSTICTEFQGWSTESQKQVVLGTIPELSRQKWKTGEVRAPPGPPLTLQLNTNQDMLVKKLSEAKEIITQMEVVRQSPGLMKGWG